MAAGVVGASWRRLAFSAISLWAAASSVELCRATCLLCGRLLAQDLEGVDLLERLLLDRLEALRVEGS
jgi:hypothetical protein